jgi:hypothetical protein
MVAGPFSRHFAERVLNSFRSRFLRSLCEATGRGPRAAGRECARAAIRFRSQSKIAAQGRRRRRGVVQRHTSPPSTRFGFARCTAGLPQPASLAGLGKLSFGKNPLRRRTPRVSERFFTRKGVAGGVATAHTTRHVSMQFLPLLLTLIPKT